MKKNKIISFSLALIIFLAPLTNVYAQMENTKKEEIIYVSTKSDGSINGTFVVNAFENNKKSKIVDYGKYEKITNLTSLDKIENSNGEISVETDASKFFYQGDNPNKELPWSINLEYYLDGVKKTPSEIVGSKGSIKIVGDITKNVNSDPNFSKYYLVQFTINLDSNKVKLKEAKNANLAYQGSMQALNYTILPENELHFEILAESNSFEMEPFNLAAIPFNMNFKMPDTSKFIDNLKILEDGIVNLSSGTNKLTDGLKEINSNSSLLFSSIKSISDGLSKSTDGQLNIIDGSTKFKDGLYQYSKGIDQLVDKIGNMGNGLDQLKNGLVQLNQGSLQFENGLKTYSEGIDKYVNGVKEIEKGHNEFTNGLSLFSEKSQGLKYGGEQILSASDQIYNSLQILDQFDSKNTISKSDIESLVKLIDGILLSLEKSDSIFNNTNLDNLLDSLVELNSQNDSLISDLENIIKSSDVDTILSNLNIKDTNNEDVKKLVNEIKNIQNQVSSAKEKATNIQNSIKSLNDFKQTFDSFKNETIQNNKQLAMSLNYLKQALNQYDMDNISNVTKQLSGFKEQYKVFHGSLKEYTQGTNQIIDSISNDLLNSSKKIDGGLLELSKNGTFLVSGIQQLVGSNSELNKGLERIISSLNFGELDQVNQLKLGINELLSNYGLIENGQEDLANGLNSLNSGLNQYVIGFGDYESGINKVTDGAVELNDGTNQLKNETSGMSEKAKIQMDEALKAFKKDDFKLVSFVDSKNTNIDLVQFVYVSDSLTKEKALESQPVEKELSFWEKVWDIIIFWD